MGEDSKTPSAASPEPGFLRRVHRTLTSLRYGGHVDCIGGVVIESADGTVREDRTFETILRERSEKALPQIAAALFGHGAHARKEEG